MSDLKKMLFVVTFASFFFCCKNEMKKQQNKNQIKQKVDEKVNYTGNYVSDNYEQRNEGYDWVAVSVRNAANGQLEISVRSRADKKEPTCTFDTSLQKFNDKTFSTVRDGKTVLFRFQKNRLVIEAEKEENENILYFYCSGGANLGGTYSKITDPLDQDQIDKTVFSKVLNLQNIGFNVSSIEKNGKNQLDVFTFGLPNEFEQTINIENQVVTNAEVEDLNSDGSPELLIFTKEKDGNKKGMVYAFSVNNNTSMSIVYFQPTQENETISSGYSGNDEFTLIETNLVQRFPMYKNNIKTDKIKQIQYKLVDGEALRKFEVADQFQFKK